VRIRLRKLLLASVNTKGIAACATCLILREASAYHRSPANPFCSAGSPQSLSEESYLNIVAFLLQANGLPAGVIELNANHNYLKNIRM
jgi:hypothetical protein